MGWPHWSLYVVIAGAWFWQNCVHELSHLIAVWHYHKKKPTGFYPGPHIHKKGFRFAGFACEPFSWPGHPNVYMSPIFGAASQAFVVWVCGAPFLVVNYPWHLAVLFVVPVVDALWWVRGYFWGSEGSDGKRYKVSRTLFASIRLGE